MKQKKLRSLSAVLLIGWCLIFLRCETTEKSMVRALYLAQKEQSITVGLLYQAPEAAADASEASGAVQLQLAQADTLAKALAAAQKQTPVLGGLTVPLDQLPEAMRQLREKTGPIYALYRKAQKRN